ncbi:unnamed protein product [Peniophora sp. CBMAI 1063]|nr:unnamed protein product [Peniophora sp. CBMAI 1063]
MSDTSFGSPSYTPSTPTLASLSLARIRLRRAELDAAVEIRRLELEALEAQFAEAHATSAVAHVLEEDVAPLTDATAPVTGSERQEVGNMDMEASEGRSRDPPIRARTLDAFGASQMGEPRTEDNPGADDTVDGVQGAEGLEPAIDTNTHSLVEYSHGSTDAHSESYTEHDVAPSAAEEAAVVTAHTPVTTLAEPLINQNAVIAGTDEPTSHPESDDQPEVIEVPDEESDEESDVGAVARVMTTREFNSRVACLAGITSNLPGAGWLTFACLMMAVHLFEGIHGFHSGPVRLPTGDVRSISKWQSRSHFTALDPPSRVERDYVALVAQLYINIRRMSFHDVSLMYGRYGLIGLAYGIIQAYSFQPSQDLLIVANDLVDLFNSIRAIRSGSEVTVFFDVDGTVEDALKDVDAAAAASASMALERLASAISRMPPSVPSKRPRNRDEDDKDGGSGTSGDGASPKPAKRAKVEA